MDNHCFVSLGRVLLLGFGELWEALRRVIQRRIVKLRHCVVGSRVVVVLCFFLSTDMSILAINNFNSSSIHREQNGDAETTEKRGSRGTDHRWSHQRSDRTDNGTAWQRKTAPQHGKENHLTDIDFPPLEPEFLDARL